ncbi:MAG: hypothetical protein RIS44_268 [Pseudomonadota bacterium]
MSAPCTLFFRSAELRGGWLTPGMSAARGTAPGSPPAWGLTFFAGAKKVSKETPNTSLFERSWLCHLTPLQRLVRSVATSIHGDVKGLFFRHSLPSGAVIPAKAGMTNTTARLWPNMLPRKNKPKTSPERQWLLAESSPHVCAPAASHPSPNRLVFRCFLGDFFCTSKRSYSAAGPNTRRGAKKTTNASANNPLKATS